MGRREKSASLPVCSRSALGWVGCFFWRREVLRTCAFWPLSGGMERSELRAVYINSKSDDQMNGPVCANSKCRARVPAFRGRATPRQIACMHPNHRLNIALHVVACPADAHALELHLKTRPGSQYLNPTLSDTGSGFPDGSDARALSRSHGLCANAALHAAFADARTTPMPAICKP